MFSNERLKNPQKEKVVKILEESDAIILRRTNIAIRKLLEAHGLPTHNPYAIFHAVLQQRETLRNDPDYLVLLAVLWSCPGHVLDSHRTLADQCFTRDAMCNLMSDYKEVSPIRYKCLMDEVNYFRQFSIDVDEKSLNFILWYNNYRALLIDQQRRISEYERWKKKAAERWKKIPGECRGLQTPCESSDEACKQCESDDKADEKLSLRLAEIFLEFVKNRSKDPRYRTKYKGVVARVERYVGAWQRSLAEEEDQEEAQEDEKILDEVIGTIFARLRINATKHELLTAIGPAYICWIFANRIAKIGDPKDDKVNLFMSEKDVDNLFSINSTWHTGHASIADRAEVYMFDALCEMWERNELGSPELSRMLFGRSLPIHEEFMKSNHSLEAQADKPVVKTEFCTYPDAEFSDEFLQRIFSTIPKMLRPSVEVVGLRQELSQKTFEKILCEPGEVVSLMPDYFGESRDLLKEFSTTRRKLTVNFEDFYRAVEQAVQGEDIRKDFEELFLIDERGIGGKYTQEWEGEAIDFFKRVEEHMDFEWEFNEPEVAESLESTLSTDTARCIGDVITLLCLRRVYREYVGKIISFSKQEFYREHTPEQYQKLRNFL